MIKLYDINKIINDDTLTDEQVDEIYSALVHERFDYSARLEELITNIINEEDLIKCESNEWWEDIEEAYLIHIQFKTTQKIINKYFFQEMDTSWFNDTITLWIEIPYGVDDEIITENYITKEIKDGIKRDFIQNSEW